MKLKILTCLCCFYAQTFAQINSLKFGTTENFVGQLSLEGLEKKEVDSLKNSIISNDKFMIEVYSILEKSFAEKYDIRSTEIITSFASETNAIKIKLQNESDLDKIKALKRQLDDLDNQKSRRLKEARFLDDVSKEYAYKKRTYRSFKFLPVRNEVEAQVYYNQTIDDKRSKFLAASLLNFGGDGDRISLYNEIYGDYFDRFRVGFGVLVTNKSDSENSEETQKDAVQRLLGGGGNGLITLNYPLIGLDNKRGDLSFKSSLVPKFAVDVPELGTEEGDYGTNLDFGLESTLFYSGALEILTIYANYRFGHIWGNDVFYSNLLKDDEDSFTLNQLSIGLAINSTFRLSWNVYWGGKFVKENFPNTISFSVIPN